VTELLQQVLLAPRAAANAKNGHAAGAQYERCQLLPIAKPPGAQRRERRHEHLLNEVVGRGEGPQVAQPIEPDARPHAPTYLALRVAIAGGDAARELSIADLDHHAYILCNLPHGSGPW
jgi:hypothetical protein